MSHDWLDPHSLQRQLEKPPRVPWYVVIGIFAQLVLLALAVAWLAEKFPTLP